MWLSLSELLYGRKNTKEKERNSYVGIMVTNTEISLSYVKLGQDVPFVEAYCVERALDIVSRKNVIVNFLHKNNIKHEYCTAILQTGQYNIHLAQAPNSSEGDYKQALMHLAKEYVDYHPTQAIVDAIKLPYLRASDGQEMIYLVVCQKSKINEIENLIEGTGLKLACIDIQEGGTQNILRQTTIPESGWLAFRALENSGQVLVVNQAGDICLSRSIDINLTRYKFNSKEEPTAQDEMELENLVAEIKRSIDYCHSVFREFLVKDIVLLPSKINLEKISDFVGSSLGYDIKRINLNDFLGFKREMAEFEQASCFFAIAAGLRKI